MELLLNQTLPLQSNDFLHHVVKRAYSDLEQDQESCLVSPRYLPNFSDMIDFTEKYIGIFRQFVVMQEDEKNSSHDDCGGGITALTFLNFAMASISIAANLISNDNSNR